MPNKCTLYRTAIQVHKDLLCLHRSYILVEAGGTTPQTVAPSTYLIVVTLSEKVRGLRVKANKEHTALEISPFSSSLQPQRLRTPACNGMNMWVAGGSTDHEVKWRWIYNHGIG